MKPFPRFFFCYVVGLTAAFLGVNASALQTLQGQAPPAVKRLQPVDRLDGASRLDLAIGLPLRNQAALNSLLRDLYNPASPRFRQYLTPAEFAKQFGPTEQDYQTVLRFAQAHGLTVTGTHPNRTLLDVNGTVGDIERAVHAHLRVYKHPTEARTFFAPDSDPSLDLTTPVLSISGLDNFVLPHPMNLKTTAWNTGTNTTAFATGSGPGGYFIGNDLRAAYAPGVTLTGAGQSVGLFELDGYYPSDIADYEILAKLPNVPLTNILLDAFSGTPGSANIEVALDIDMAICMAPGLLQVMVYEGTTPNDILNRMATDNQAKQLSSSWGFPINTNTEQIYLQFAAQGQSIFQASGDSGAYAGAIQSPCGDPNVTVVGGTSLTTAGPGGAWASETTWSGSGGGVSTNYTIPTWQTNVNMTANHGSTTMRNIPDVACLADVLIWLIAYDGEQGAIGGSSASTPMWAGFAALVNQQAAANGKPSIGFFNPALYAIAEGSSYSTAFHDITTGNNTNSISPNRYFAVPGYDLCTGWGSPTGSNLINALASPPDPLNITPATNFIVTGPAGGPFNSGGENFVLTNTGTNSLSWALGNTSSWLTASPASGILAPGGSAALVNLGLTSTASNLSAGSYTASLLFIDLNDGVSQSRGVTLDIVAPPIIYQQPVNESVPLGGTATFSVVTTTNSLLFYQWQDDGTNLTDGGNIFGSATSTLTISNVSATSVGNYTVTVSNAANAVQSTAAALTISSSAPVITVQPVNQAALQGTEAIFSSKAAGNAPLVYQWQWNTTNLTDGGNIIGSASSALTVTSITPANEGTYSLIVSNALGSTASSNATLTVVSLTAPGVSLSTLYSFTGGIDGGNPNGLLQETNGDFYGTTQIGGSNSSGTVFHLTQAGAFTTLDWFNNTTNTGQGPQAALVQGPDGALYGTTQKGGTKGYGTIFKTTTNGALTILVNFSVSNGAEPDAAMIVGADGALYGTTPFGGGYRDGYAFRMTTTGTLSTLALFDGIHGAEPNELLQIANGTFYGTTLEGGPNGNGVIFEISTNRTLISPAFFNYTNGGYLPYGGLVQMPDGNFYGTTYEGGAPGYGTVFAMSSSGVVSTLHSFTGGSDGGHPAARLTPGADGNLYGTTAYGGTYDDGTVFRIAPNGGLVTLLQFDEFDGANPEAPLVLETNGTLFGTTENGGVDDMGVIFQLTIDSPSVQISSQPVNQEAFVGDTVFFSTSAVGNPPLYYQWMENGTNLSDGAGISGSSTRVLTLFNVNQSSSAAYSLEVSNATSSALSQDGVLGVITSPPQITSQPVSETALVGETAEFVVTATGDIPLSYQWQENGTNLADGGQISGSSTSALTLAGIVETNDGTYSVIVSNAVASVNSEGAVLSVFAPSSPGTIMQAIYSFTGGNDGGIPTGLTVGSNGLLYGVTENGGMYGAGSIFSLSTNGTLITLASFDETNGAMPASAMVQGSNDLLYGTAQLGGSNSAGTIFSVTTNGTITSIFSFASNLDSVNPFTSLSQDRAGDFYGATINNAAPANGNIFLATPNGVVTNLYTFTGNINGTMPTGALTLGADGNFYGMTGNPDELTTVYGNIFKMTPAGQVTNLYSFTGGADGFSPAGQLVQGDDGDFYGATRFNKITFNGFGGLFYGTLFKVTPTGTLTTLYSLHGLEVYTDGAVPSAGLIQTSDGNFYGVTLEGYSIEVNGVTFNNSYGTVFRITPGGSLTTLTSFNDSDDGEYPQTPLVQGPDGCLYGVTPYGGPYNQGTIYRISFTSAPQILTQPASQTNVLGANVNFFVTDFGAPQLAYQWRQNGTNLSDGPQVLGSTARVLTLRNINPANAGAYTVIVSNSLGSVTSSSALLAVDLPPFFQTVSQTGNTLNFTWSATPGKTYQLQSSSNLGSTNWINVGGNFAATNPLMSTSQTIATNGQIFYRLLMSP